MKYLLFFKQKDTTHKHLPLPPVLGNDIDKCTVDTPDHYSIHYSSSRKRKPDHLPDYTNPKKRKDVSEFSWKKIEHGLMVNDKNVLQNHLERNGFKCLNKTSQNKFTTDLEHSLLMYTDLDVLDEDNKFICQMCTETNKSKVKSII